MGLGSKITGRILLAISLAVVSGQIATAQPALPSTFKSQIVHSLAGADSKGNIFIGEVNNGQRYYKYAFKGMGPAPTR